MLSEDVLNKFTSIWGDAFDYSKSEYVSKKDKMLVRCKKHDEWFYISPEMHEVVRGCPVCKEEEKNDKERRINESFIKKCKAIYGDKYTYEKTHYTYSSKTVTITCPVHGDVEITVKSLLNGCGCGKCNKKNNGLGRRSTVTVEDCKEAFKSVHGDTYEYDFSTFTRNTEKMRMICHKHGEFWQTPAKHKAGQGCPSCGLERTIKAMSFTREDFINRANQVHNFKYDYSLTNFLGTQEKAVFICHEKDENGVEHGPFEQVCNSHLMGCGCPKCAQIARNTHFTKPFSEFLEMAKEVHSESGFTYDESSYKNLNTPMRIICPVHGEFLQKPVYHLRGHGCPKCAKNGILRTYEEFEELAAQVHDNKYTYHHDYIRCADRVVITCPVHGDFIQTANSHIQGHGCPKCSNNASIGEDWILSIINESGVSSDIIVRDRSVLANKEIDILLNDLRIGFEYNGLYWHSEMCGKNKFYHLNKTQFAEVKGYSLIQVFEDEYMEKPNITESKIKRIIGFNNGFVYIPSEDCVIKEVQFDEIKDFFSLNDINGPSKATIHFACYFNDEIVCGMSFVRNRNNALNWIIARACTRIDVDNDELFEIIYHQFIESYNPSEVIAYEDRRWVNGKVDSIYPKLGFIFDTYTPPEYSYYHPRRLKFGRIKRTDFKTSILTTKYGFEITESNDNLETSLGFTKIWDCGKIKYKWNNNKSNNI